MGGRRRSRCRQCGAAGEGPSVWAGEGGGGLLMWEPQAHLNVASKGPVFLPKRLFVSLLAPDSV